MRHAIVFGPEAVADLRTLGANIRTKVLDAIERHLRFNPTATSKSRIKRLEGMAKPQYRLRVDDVRVLYDVYESTVNLIAVVPKSRMAAWLRQFGEENGHETGDRI